MSSLQTTLLGKRVAFLRGYTIHSISAGDKRHDYKGQLGKIVGVNAFGGNVNVIVCPENKTLPMATVDVSYLQLVKEGTVQDQILETLAEARKIEEETRGITKKTTSIMEGILEDMKPRLREETGLSPELSKLIDSNPSSLGGSHGEEG